MKKFLLLIGIILITISCEENQLIKNFDNDQSIQNINGSWVVVSYEDFDKNSVVKKNDVDSWNGMDVVLTFTIDSLYGRNTTNTVSGNFTLSERTIHIIRYGGTKMGQPEWGNMFSDIVHNLESYKVNENQLRFYYNNNKNSVTLNRK
jgi:heat shock protein HslJ